MSKVEHFSTVMADLIDEWRAARVALREIEKAEHPDITDVLGRVWTWIDGQLYRHDSMAWTKDMVESPNLRGPRATLLDNPNYTWCARCLGLMQP